MFASPVDLLFSLALAALRLLDLAILARILLSWVDPSPYPNTQLKVFLYRLTDPILEPLRRVIPPLGPVDISPMVAIIALNLIESAVRVVFENQGYSPPF